jgi:hypothetical protein
MDHKQDIVRAARHQEPSMTPGPAGLKPSAAILMPGQNLRALSYVAALGKKPSGGHLEFLDRRFAQPWPDRNRRSTLPNHDTFRK